MLTLVPKKYWTKVIGGHRFYWSLATFTKAEGELLAKHLEAEWLQVKLARGSSWKGDPTLTMKHLSIQQRLGVGPFRVLNTVSPAPVNTPAKDANFVAPATPSDLAAVGPHMTFGQVVALYLGEQVGMSPKKQREIRNKLKATNEFFNGTAIGAYARTTFVDVAANINAREWGDRYKKDIFYNLRRLFLWASERENLGFNTPGNLGAILVPIKTKKTASAVWDKDADKYWSKDEIKLALSKATGEVRAFILLGLNCAYCTSEIGALEKSHLKANGSLIQTIRNKTAGSNNPPKLRHKLWKETQAAIQASMSNDERLVFTGSKGNDVASNDYVGKVFRAFVKEHKLKLPEFKMLRKTSSNEVQKNSNPDIASLHLGHQTKTVTETFYTESNWSKLDKTTDKFRKDLADCF